MTDTLGPDPRRIHSLDDLARELRLLLTRSAKGTGKPRVSLAELTRRLKLPPSSKSTVHSYVSGKTLPPEDFLDRIVIALGATGSELRQWSDAWFRISDQHRNPLIRRGTLDDRRGTSPAESVIRELQARLRGTASRPIDFYTISAQNLDHIHRVDMIAPDHEEGISEPLRCAGGSGSNTAVALALLGLRVGVAGAVADDPDGQLLRKELAAQRIDDSFLLTIAGARRTGRTMVFTDWEGRRLIYVQAGVNERLAEELRTRDLEESLFDHMRQSRVVHISSFTGTAERTLQEGLVSQLDGQTVLTFTPGALYSALGADRLNTILRRTNVLFLYEQQLDRLLARSSAGENLDGAELTQKMARLYEWRRHRGSQEPMAVIIKRPAHLARGAMEEYLSIGYGRDRLEDLGGADAGIRSFEVIDSTGAGDALAAGFIRSLFEQSLPGECGNLAFVMALSASSVQGGRRGLPHSNQLRDCWRRYLPAVLVPKWLPPSQ